MSSEKNTGESSDISREGTDKTAASGVSRRDVVGAALRAAPVVLLLTARGARAQGSAASGAPSG